MEKGVEKTAKNMKTMKLPTEIIMKVTGVTSEEIEQL